MGDYPMLQPSIKAPINAFVLMITPINRSIAGDANQSIDRFFKRQSTGAMGFVGR
jgi:hypothetical protein